MTRKTSAELQYELDLAAPKVKVGAVYAHYRGQNYRTTGLAIIEATAEVGVVYQAEYGERITFVRPLSSWLDTIEIDGQRVPRFGLVDLR